MLHTIGLLSIWIIIVTIPFVVLIIFGRKLIKVGTPSASHNTRRIEMPPSCGACPARSGVCEGAYGEILCHAHLWRHFIHA
jgi:hypothetical protein